MNIISQITELDDAFKTIAGMVGESGENIQNTLKAVAMRLDLLCIYEQAIKKRINPLEAAEMHDLAAVLIDPDLANRSRRLIKEIERQESGYAKVIKGGEEAPTPRPVDCHQEIAYDEESTINVPVPSEEHREKLRKAWKYSAERHDQTVIDMPFAEYAEEFTDYLSEQIAVLKEKKDA